MFKCISLQGSVDCNLVSLDTCKPPPQPNTSHMIGEGGLGKTDLASQFLQSGKKLVIRYIRLINNQIESIER